MSWARSNLHDDEALLDGLRTQPPALLSDWTEIMGIEFVRVGDGTSLESQKQQLFLPAWRGSCAEERIA